FSRDQTGARIRAGRRSAGGRHPRAFVRILFLTHRLPYAPNRGDRVRAYHLLHEMSQWAEVDLVSLVHDPDEASHIRDLRNVTTSITTAPVPRIFNAIRAFLALPT